jgi:hypothetical protein
MQELIHEKRKISSTPVSPGTNPEWFVVDALGNFYGVTGYGVHMCLAGIRARHSGNLNYILAKGRLRKSQRGDNKHTLPPNGK